MNECYIVATGASLKGFDFKLLEDNNVIAVNDAYKYVKHKYIVAIDKKWNFRHFGNLDKTMNATNIDFDSDELLFHYKVTNNSGYAAVLLAVFKWRYTKIHLLGFDIKWNDYKYFYSTEKCNPGEYAINLNYYNIFLKAGVQIINYSENSPIKQFKKDSLFNLQQKLLYEKVWKKYDYRSNNEMIIFDQIINDLDYYKKNYNRILEIGCGNGEVIKCLREKGFSAFGVDIIENYENYLFQAPAWNIDKIFANDVFDLTYSIDTFEHFPEDKIEKVFSIMEKITLKKSIHYICCRPSSLYFNYQMHLTIKPIEWWKKFESKKIEIHEAK